MRLLALLLLCISLPVMANEGLLEAVQHDDILRATNILTNDETVDINIQDAKGKTPLIIAAEHNNEKMAWALIDIGAEIGHEADFDIKDNYGNTASVYSYMHDNNRLFTFLDANMERRTFSDMVEFMKALKKCDSNKIQDLLSSKNIQLEYKDVVYGEEESTLQSVVEIAAGKKCVGFLHSFTNDPYLLYNVSEKTKNTVFEAFVNERMPLALRTYDQYIRKNEISIESLPKFMIIAFENKNKEIANEVYDLALNFNDADIQNALYIYAKNYGWNEQADFISPAVDNGLVITEGKDILEAEIACGDELLIKSNLECATIKGQFETAQAFVKTGVDFSQNIALHRSILSNKLDFATLFIKGGADVNQWSRGSTDKNGTVTPLMIAVEAANEPAFNLLIENGAKVDLHSKNDSALTIAINNEDLYFAKLLLENKASPELHASGFDTAILESIQRDNLEMLKLVISYNADVNNNAGHNAPPIGFAIEVVERLEMLKVLIEAGADVNKKFNDFENYTVLTYAAMQNFSKSVSYLVSLPDIDVNALTISNESALSFAVYNGNLSMAKTLTEAKIQADIETQDSLLITTLKLSTSESSKKAFESQNEVIQMLEILIDGGADVNKMKGNYLETPLSTAFDVQNLAAGTLFVDRGANVDFVNFNSETVLAESIEDRDLEFAEMLVSADASLKYEKLDGKNKNLKWELFKNRFSLFKEDSKEIRVFAKKLQKHIRQKRRADRKSIKEAKEAVKSNS